MSGNYWHTSDTDWMIDVDGWLVGHNYCCCCSGSQNAAVVTFSLCDGTEHADCHDCDGTFTFSSFGWLSADVCYWVWMNPEGALLVITHDRCTDSYCAHIEYYTTHTPYNASFGRDTNDCPYGATPQSTDVTGNVACNVTTGKLTATFSLTGDTDGDGHWDCDPCIASVTIA